MGMKTLNFIKAFKENKCNAQAVARNGSPIYHIQNVVKTTCEINHSCTKEKALTFT
jgi:hypothetical protein